MSYQKTDACIGCGNRTDTDAIFCDECGLARPVSISGTEPESAERHSSNPETPNMPADIDPQMHSSVMKRYSEGYLYANFINNAGGVLMAVGITLGVITFFASVGIGGNLEDSAARGMMGPPKGAGIFVGFLIFLLGALFGIVFVAIGIILRAAAQAMKATFDGAVYASPFLNDGDRAKVMNLPNA